MPPILTIAIPTYNRARHLRETLDAVVPQLNERVEIVVLDNCSQDHTTEIVGRYDGLVGYVRHDTNIGSDHNMIACLGAGRGEYVWVLCDDDLPKSDAVARILDGIDENCHPPCLFATQDWQDVFCSGYDNEPSGAEWLDLDANAFLLKASFFFTAATGIVVRKDAVDVDFIESRVGTFLVPGAITIHTVDAHDRGLFATKPIVVCRGDNSGGFDGLTVFVRNLLDLLRCCRKTGFRKDVLDAMCEANLSGVVFYVIQTMKLTPRGLRILCANSWKYRAFWSVVLPAIVTRWLQPYSLKTNLVRAKAFAYKLGFTSVKSFSEAAFRTSVGRLAGRESIEGGWSVQNGSGIRIGRLFRAGRDLKLAIVGSESRLARPQIMIGDQVRIGCGARIEASNRIEIGNKVTIGDDVEIIDRPETTSRSTNSGEGVVIHSDVSIGDGVRIESGVWIGVGARIHPGVKIAARATIQDFAEVVSDVEEGQFVAGRAGGRIPQMIVR